MQRSLIETPIWPRLAGAEGRGGLQIIRKPAVGQDITTQSSAPREELCRRASKVRAEGVACVHLSYMLRNMQQRVMLSVSTDCTEPLAVRPEDAERWHSEMD